MLMEFAEVRNARLFNSTSENACFTSRWQSSNDPRNFQRGDIFA